MFGNRALVSTGQIKELLLVRGERREQVRRALITLLAEHMTMGVSNLDLWELPHSVLVGTVIKFECDSRPMGATAQRIIAREPVEETESQLAARRIMGDSFLGLCEVTETFGLVTPRMQEVLAEIPFSEATLRACRDTHVLVADIGLSIVDLYGYMKPNVLKRDISYKGLCFGQSRMEPAWRLIGKTALPGSADKTWDEQRVLPGADEDIPRAREMLYAYAFYRVARNKCLIEAMVRTSTLTSNNQQAIVNCSLDGATVSNFRNDHERDFIGLALSRKPLIVR